MDALIVYLCMTLKVKVKKDVFERKFRHFSFFASSSFSNSIFYFSYQLRGKCNILDPIIRRREGICFFIATWYGKKRHHHNFCCTEREIHFSFPMRYRSNDNFFLSILEKFICTNVVIISNSLSIWRGENCWCIMIVLRYSLSWSTLKKVYLSKKFIFSV